MIIGCRTTDDDDDCFYDIEGHMTRDTQQDYRNLLMPYGFDADSVVCGVQNSS